MSPLLAVLLFLPSSSVSKFVKSNVSYTASVFGPLPEEKWTENRDYSEQNSKENTLPMLMFVRLFGCVYVIAMAIVIHYLLIRVRSNDTAAGQALEEDVHPPSEHVLVATVTTSHKESKQKKRKTKETVSNKTEKAGTKKQAVGPAEASTQRGSAADTSSKAEAPTQSSRMGTPPKKNSMRGQVSTTKGKKKGKEGVSQKKKEDKKPDSKDQTRAESVTGIGMQSKRMPRAKKGYHEDEIKIMEDMFESDKTEKD